MPRMRKMRLEKSSVRPVRNLLSQIFLHYVLFMVKSFLPPLSLVKVSPPSMPAEPIVTTATVTEERDERTVYLALRNGKTTLGHLAKAGLPLRPQLTPGTQVQVEMTSFDFEKARIVAVLDRS